MEKQLPRVESIRREAARSNDAASSPETAEAFVAGGDLLRLLLENSSDGVNVCELRLESGRAVRRLVFCNQRFVEMSGRLREELMRCPDLNQLTHENWPDAGDDIYLANIRAGRACQGLGAWNRPDGLPNEHEWVAVPVPMHGKTYLLGIDRDVTERNRAQAALEKERNEALAIFNSAPVAIWFKDTENCILRLNAAAARMMGMHVNEVEGRSIAELFSPAYAVAAHADDLEVIHSGMPKLGMIHSYATPSGGTCWLQMDKVPSFDEQGRVIGVIVFALDITEVKRTEEERLGVERRLQRAEKYQSLGALAGGVAHDFNNLLTAVLGKVSLARAGLPTSSPVQRHLDGIETSSRRAAELCQQMLAYSGHGRFDLQPLDLRAFVESCLPLLRLSLRPGMQLELLPGPNSPNVLADPAQIRQVLSSLVTNAAEACDGKEAGVIHLRTGVEPHCNLPGWSGSAGAESDLPSGECAFVEVSDNGCGMKPDVQARIFDPFYSTKFTGRGLGLAAAAGIVRGHRGVLQVHSEPESGSRFRLLLPCAAGASPSDSAGQSNDGASAAATPTPAGGGAVLVVDDEEPIRQMTASMLDVLGFASLQAANGAEALELYRQNVEAIDAVLLDLATPGLDAETISRRLRQLNPAAKIIFMSASQLRPSSASTVQGADGAIFLRKPFTLDTLRERLAALVPASPKSG